MKYFSSLRQARKNLGLSLQDTAYLLDMDVSNLSKCEYEKIVPSMRVVVGYYLITRAPFKLLLQTYVADLRNNLIKKVLSLMDQANPAINNPKNERRIQIHGRILKNLTVKEEIYGNKK